MLFQLVCLAVCASAFPMSWEQCAVTVGDYRWDLDKQGLGNKVFTGTTEIHGWEFYVKLCRELKESEVPDHYNITMIGANAVRCNTTSKQCIPFASIWDFQWTLKNPTDPTKGLVWESDGIPYRVSSVEWADWEMEFEFECNRSSSSDEPQIIYDHTKGDPRLVLKWSNLFSCGSRAATTPTPTPEFNPDTDVLFREPDLPTFAVQMDMKDVDGGRFGIHSPVIVDMESGDVRFLILNPTRRMYDCPFGAKCDDPGENGTSAWVCTFERQGDDVVLDDCLSYGYLPEVVTYDLVSDGDITKGFYYRFEPTGEGDGRLVEINVKCDNLYPEGHMMIDPLATEFSGINNKFLKVVAEAKEACIRPYPTVAPVAGCEISKTVEGYTLDLDLHSYTDASNPHKAAVMVKNQHTGEVEGPMDLIYSPCHGMTCPDGCDCEGDEDALVWLCEQPSSMMGHVPFCTGYGLHENNIRLSITSDYIFAGVDVDMKGDNKREAQVHWKCNKSLGSKEIVFESPVVLQGTVLSFDVSALGACVTGSGPTPTPPPRLVPMKPQKGPTPTPSPLPSPNPIDFVFNDTHYIYVNLEASQEAPLRTHMAQFINGRNTSVYVEWSSWEQLPCPAGWDCEGFTSANLWVCWWDENWEHYCHPVADKYVPGTYSHAKRQDNLDAGINIIYEGQYGVNMEIDVRCDPKSPTNRSLPLENSIISYRATMNNGEWTFNTTSGVGCPHKFDDTIKPPTAERTPPPEDPEQTFSWSGDVDGKRIALNLPKMKKVQEDVFLGIVGSFHKAEVVYSPYELIGCPPNKACGTYGDDLANVWKCIGDNYEVCYPVGDKRYGVTMFPVNTSNPMAGITVNYDGGAEKSETHFLFQCNYSIPYGEIEFDETGTETPQHAIVLFAHTRAVCPDETHDTVVGGGGIFLVIVFGAAVGYFALGTLVMFIITGRVEVPFGGFWMEVAESIKTAVVFIFTLGRGTTPKADVSYDKI